MRKEDIIDILKDSTTGFDDGFGGSIIAVDENMFEDVAIKIMKLNETPPYLISNE